NPDKVMARAAGACRMSVENLRGNRKYPEVSRARGLACFWMVEHLGENVTSAARMLGVTQSAGSRLVKRGREVAARLKIDLEKE
ncbi:MAG: LysR family transcriptional regulator, partial [Planctomycetota bacterium]